MHHSCSFLQLLTLDPSLSRLDPSLLSEQALMEMFVEGFQKKARFQDKNGNYTDISEWPHVTTEDREVTVFSIEEDLDYSPGHFDHLLDGTLGGSLNPQFLPRSVCNLTLTGQGLTGTVDTEAFGPNLQELRLDRNSFIGNFEIESLPRAISVVDIAYNKFHGKMNLAACPHTLWELQAQDNTFEGSVDLGNLPAEMYSLDLSHNHFTGSVNFHKLPKTLNYLRLENNPGLYGALFTSALSPDMHRLHLSHVKLQGNVCLRDVICQSEKLHKIHFSAFGVPESTQSISIHVGTVDFTRLPASLGTLELENCSLDGMVNLENLPEKIEKLSIAHNKLSGPVSFYEKYDELCQVREIDISDNLFSGELDLEKLPRNLHIFNASNNNLRGCVDFSQLPEWDIESLDISQNANLYGSTDESNLPDYLRVLRTDGTKVVRNDTVPNH